MKKVFFVFSLIFSLLFINGKEYNCDTKDDSFRNIEKVLVSEYDFVENGVKLEYTTDITVEDEYNRIFYLLCQNKTSEILQEENYIETSMDKIEYKIHIYTAYNKTRVDIISINNQKDTTIEDIKKVLQKLRSDNYLDERYFSYVKGRLKTDNQNLSLNIKKELKIDTLNTLGD